MFLIVLALFILGPIIEIYVLIKAGATFGAGPVVLACLGTAILGGLILRIQGFAAAQAARADLQAGKPPVEAAIDGVFLLVAAPFLLTPGFITDVLGFTLLIPFVRHWIARRALLWFRQSIARGESSVVIRRF